jgi:hypothetical protein
MIGDLQVRLNNQRGNTEVSPRSSGSLRTLQTDITCRLRGIRHLISPHSNGVTAEIPILVTRKARVSNWRVVVTASASPHPTVRTRRFP